MCLHSFMSRDVLGDIAVLTFIVASVVVWSYGGFKWGAFAAGEAVHSGSSKYLAYAVALLLPFTLCVLMASEPHLARWISKAFWVMAAGGSFGVFTRYHRLADTLVRDHHQ